ncbi:stalk domain-containing protein [Paenibacillus sp. BC26]|uniref:stalk domain-containing protein n=1 Tax=Paenibacillus sp. BC26 TaxID=1881032 RepID=UPI0008F29096|nr:stalk domain-containing protein [Paenibacillus sp. BC26]SFS76420.1 Copper amine oxidase N-terminal domain-containing protein [Paenibacillus sp. BC26]
MKRSKLIAVVGLSCLLGSSMTYASENIGIFINGERQELQGEQQQPRIINNRVYIPLRAFSEESGSVVGFDNTNKSVYVTNNYLRAMKSEVVEKSQNEDFQLKLLSGKSNYTFGEPLSIWSTITAYENITVYSSGSFLDFYLEDSSGYRISLGKAAMAIENAFEKDGEYIQVIAQQLAIMYNMEKNNIINYDQYMQITPQPSALPEGDYTVGVIADYSKTLKFSDRTILKNKISIHISKKN